MNPRSHDECLLNKLADEFTQRLRRRESPALEQYIDQYPHLANEIRDIFPTLVLLESSQAATNTDVDFNVDGLSRLGSLESERLGEYRILRELGRGGMGVVFEAIHQPLGRRVALKALPLKSVTTTAHVQRFLREARAAATLQHEHIVPVYDVGEADGMYFYTMQFIDGQPLSALLNERGEGTIVTRDIARWRAIQLAKISRLATHCEQTAHAVHHGRYADLARQPHNTTLSRESNGNAWGKVNSTASLDSTNQKDPRKAYYRRIAQIGKQVAEALAYAHGEGVLHRDIKPSNLLLDTSGNVWVADFGLAQVAGQDELTASGDVVGTLRYLSPERFEGHMDERGDIYSLGVTLYEMLSGRPPFTASTRAELIDHILHARTTPLRRINAKLPHDLETIVLKAMAPDPSQRYASARALADELNRFITGLPINARRLSTWENTWRWCRRNKALATMTAVAITLLVGISALSSVASIQLKRQLGVTRQAQQESRERRVATLIAHSRASRLTGRVGQRFEAVRAVREAIQIARELSLSEPIFDQLRNELIAASCLADVEKVGDPIDLPPGATFDMDPQFERYAIGDASGNVSIYRLEDRKLLASLPGVGMPVADYGGVVFSPDGRFLQHLSRAGQRKQFRLWQLASQPRLVLDVPDVLWAVFRPNSQQIAIKLPDVASETALYQFPRSASIHLYETATGREVSVPFRSKDTASFCFHPSLPRLAVTDSQSIRIIDLETTEEIDRWESPGHLFPLWDAEGRILISTDDKSLLIFRRDTNRSDDLTPLAGHKTKGVIYAFNPSGDALVSNDWSGTLRLWDFRTGHQLLAVPAGGFSTSMRFSSDGQLLSGAAGRGVMQLVRIEPARELRQFDLGLDNTDHSTRASASPDGHLLAATGKSATLLLDFRTGRKMAELPGHRLPLIFDSDRSLITHSALPEGLTRWAFDVDQNDPTILHVASHVQLKAYVGEKVKAVPIGGLDEWAATADARLIAMPNYSRGATLLAANDGTDGPGFYRVMQLGPQHDVRFCAMSPDGMWVATGSHWTPGSVTIWDVATGTRVKDVVSDRGIPQFSPDGRWLVVCSNSSASGGRLFRVGSWEPSAAITLGHLSFDPSSGMMAVESELSVIRLLVPESGHEIARLTVSNMTQLKPVCFSPDGSRFAAFGMNDGQLYIWNLQAIRERLAEFGLNWTDSRS